MANIGSVSTGPSAGVVTGVASTAVPQWNGTITNPYQGGGGVGYQGSPGGPGGGMLTGINRPEPRSLTPEEAIAIAVGPTMQRPDGSVTPGPRPFSDSTGYNPMSGPTVQPIETRTMPYQMPTTYASIGQSMSPQTPWMPPSLPSLNQTQAFNALGGPTASGASSVQGMLSQLLMALRGNVGF